jgi:hypothetical protein
MFGSLSYRISQSKIMTVSNSLQDSGLTEVSVLPKPISHLPAGPEESLDVPPNVLIT